DHPPHRVDVVAGEAPVALGFEIAEVELVDQSEPDRRCVPRDLAGHELQPTPWRFVVEKYSAGRMQVIRLAVVDGNEVPVDLRDPVRRTRIEGCRLGLRNLQDLAEHLAR